MKLFTVDLLEEEIKRLRQEDTEESRIIAEQYKRELVLLRRIDVWNIDEYGKTLEEFEKYMSDKIIFFDTEEHIKEIGKFAKLYKAFKKIYYENEE